MVLTGRDPAWLDAAVTTLRDEGLATEAATFDVTDQPSVVAGVEGVEAEPGPIDVLVNNAGIQRRMPIEDFPIKTRHELMRTNLDKLQDAAVFLASAASGFVKGYTLYMDGKVLSVLQRRVPVVLTDLGASSWWSVGKEAVLF